MGKPSAAKSDPALANRSSGRYDKTARNLLAAIHFAAAIIRLN
jgi:hypothetical protein